MSFQLRPIQEIVDKLGVPQEYVEFYGRYSCKLRLELLQDKAITARPKGKLVLVTAITPTTSGEGKTVTSIGLSLGLNKIGKRAAVTSREPSLGPVFGIKGGAAGGGASQVLPAEKINLHFNGDFHAITSAHNLLAALIDAHIHNGNALGIDTNNISWPRTMDMNDRALRTIATGLGGRTNGPARETGFVITAASEIMAIMAMASSREDLRKRLSNIVIGYNREGAPVRAGDLQAAGAMMMLLNEAIMPNLVQTSENTPAFVHCGPFGNIAHGTSSVISQKMGMQLCDYAVNECGFGADLGAEKYFDIVMQYNGIKPAVAVIVASVKALASHSVGKDAKSGVQAPLDAGFANLGRHIENVKKFGVPAVVALNKFPGDTDDQLKQVLDFCKSVGADAALSDVFNKGGEGARELAEKVVAAASSSNEANVKSLYPLDTPLEQKISTVATQIYGAKEVVYDTAAKNKLKKFADMGYGNLPVCMAKTQYSFTDNPKLTGAPSGWTLTVTDANLSAGAGFVVVIVGNMMLMPGLGKVPQAIKMDVDENGNFVGLV